MYTSIQLRKYTKIQLGRYTRIHIKKADQRTFPKSSAERSEKSIDLSLYYM